MSDLLKKSVAYAFAIISAVFTFIPEVIFQAVDKTLQKQGFVYSLGVWKLNPYAFFKELIFEQKICKNILSIQRRL